MNANLTRSGLWLFAAAVLFLGIGVVGGRVVSLVFGVSLVLLLGAVYALTIPTALALDRRFVEAEVREETAAGDGGHAGHVVGDEVETTVAIRNHSAAPLFGLEARPYGAQQLEVEGDLAFEYVGPTSAASRTISVRAERSGRWMFQGFDVAVTDPFGLVEAHDYIPCNFAFEFYPRVGRLADRQTSRRLERSPREREGARRLAALSSGTVTRELREYQPGDPLRHIAWKATARVRKLISREFEDEIAAGTTILLDISGSMRGGAWQGQKLEHGIELAGGISDELISTRNRVGLLTFDDKVYGYIPPGSSRSNHYRILRHLLGLNSIVDSDLTELDDDELLELLADYLLVQERLDFRKGQSEGAINETLLRRWVASRLEVERERYHSPVLREGIVDTDLSEVREFVQLRGLPVPYRVESRLGPKGRGLAAAFDRIVHDGPQRQFVVVITDLCGVSNFEVLDRGLAMARHDGHHIRFVVPFTPSYYLERGESSEKADILLELFTASERDERMRGVEFLQEKGVDVDFIGERDRSAAARG